MPLTQSELARRKPASARAGFSLVEVLAALVVTTLLILALTPLAGQMLATWARGSEAARAVELKTRGLGRLREDLRQAIAWSGFGLTENLLMFRGTDTSMSFPVSTGLGVGRDGVEMLSITVDTSVDGRALVRRRAPLIGSTHGVMSDPVVLFSGPFKYVFRYYTRDGLSQPVWSNRTELPARVELIVTDRRGPIFSAPVELPVFASLSAGCLVSSGLPGCPVSSKQRDDNEWMKEYGLVPDER
jgi:type II secretory pathway component PulJ